MIFTLFTNDGRFQVDEYGTRNVFASASLAEEGIEAIVSGSDGLVRRHLAVRLNAMFQTIQFPAGITDLDSSLSNMD